MSTKQVRAIWPLGKVRVTEITDNTVTLSFEGKAKIVVTHNGLQHYDVRLGDLMPLYTEVLLAKPVN